MIKLTLNTPIQEIHGIGPRFLTKFGKLGILTIKDLLWHFPNRYEDWSETATIKELVEGDEKTIQVEVQKISVSRSWRKRMIIVEATCSDESGIVKAVWFNQPYIGNILKEGSLVNLSGKVSYKNGKLYLSNPAYELITARNKDNTKHTGRLVPIYPETKGLTSKGIRLILYSTLENLEKIKEFMPSETLKDFNFPEVNESLRMIHVPESREEANLARKRFSFEELFLLQIRNLLQKVENSRVLSKKVNIDRNSLDKTLSDLPFQLTDSQQKSLSEILGDLEGSRPMNRLLQGDVGSGKTIVVGLAAILTANQYQVAFMAPTEILARQHYATMTKFFGNFTKGIALLLSKDGKKFLGDGLEMDVKKTALIKDVSLGKIGIVIGTHALIQKTIKFKNLGLVIVDEQHRFGVSQRANLLSQNLDSENDHSHFLSMSATPIPRTLMLSIFGDLDLSIIEGLPSGRKPIITKIIDTKNRDKAYAFIRGQVRRGRQVFVVCPRIEKVEEESSYAALQILEIKAVKEEYEKLSKKIFPDLRVGILHGKLKPQEKESSMSDFANGKTDILVTTSVVEVGVDVPNATIMMIEGSERFGLAQLYQFRGRVGRAEHQSFCFLFTESDSNKTHDRLSALLTAKNGFELAEKDLEFRGPGEFLGDNQTGLPDIAMEGLRNPALIKSARSAAEKVIETSETLDKYPELKEKIQSFKKEIHLE